MAEEYRNVGPVTRAETMRDVTSKTYIAHEINQQATTVIYTNGTVKSTIQPRNISFKNIPEPHGAFIGRVEYVKSAIKYLSHPVADNVQIQFPCLVIHALGGYGKTQTARKIASVCRKDRKMQHFIWIDSEDDVSIKKCLVAAMKQIGLDASDEIGEATNRFYDLLARRNKEKFLIIFDNVEDFDKILKFLPLNHRAKNFAVLMTSQRPFQRESYGHVRNQPLDLMSEKDGIELVENMLGTSTMDSEEDKKLLVERSGRIALVLCVMISTVKFQRKCKSDYSLKDYLGEMNHQPIQYSDESNLLDLTYEKSLQKIVRFAVKKMNAAGGPIERVAVKVFDRLAYFSSTNWLAEEFVQNYFRDICEEVRYVDMKLPIKPIRLVIGKLSEFSLAQIGGNEFTVHRWIQAARRLDLKESGDDSTVVEKLVADMNDEDRTTSVIWQHAVKYAGLVNQFYAEKGTLLKFPVSNVVVLGEIIRRLTESTDFQPFENYSEEVEEIICHHIYRPFSSLQAVTRIVNVFNYEMSKKSKKLLSVAISARKLDVVNSLVREKSCLADEDHLRQCFGSQEITFLSHHLRLLKNLNIEIIERRPGKNVFERALNKLKSLRGRPVTSQCIVGLEISYLLSALPDSHPLKIGLCEAIEKNCDEHLLERIVLCKSAILESQATKHWSSHCIKVFEIIRVVLSALEKRKPGIESDDIRKKYSENNLLECLFICGRTHCCIEEYQLNTYVFDTKSSWNDLHRAAYENNLTAIESIDRILIESKDKYGSTPLMIAVEAGACEATTVLLENYSANVNAMNDSGDTALAKAIEYRHASICKTLLRHGAKTHWRTEWGASVHALLGAVKTFKNYDGSEPEEIIVAILTSSDCDVCATDDDGNNILHLLVLYFYATRYKPDHRMLHLIQSANAALVNMQNSDELTPVQLAKKLRAQFSDDHWHVASLRSFTSEIGKVFESVICDRELPTHFHHESPYF